MKPELRSYKNIVYELSKSGRGYIYIIRTLKFSSEWFEQKTDAIADAKKQIEKSKAVQ